MRESCVAEGTLYAQRAEGVRAGAARTRPNFARLITLQGVQTRKWQTHWKLREPSVAARILLAPVSLGEHDMNTHRVLALLSLLAAAESGCSRIDPSGRPMAAGRAG